MRLPVIDKFVILLLYFSMKFLVSEAVDRLRMVPEYQIGVHGFRELCRIYKMAQQARKGRIRPYLTFGAEDPGTGSSASTVIRAV